MRVYIEQVMIRGGGNPDEHRVIYEAENVSTPQQFHAAAEVILSSNLAKDLGEKLFGAGYRTSEVRVSVSAS